MSSMATNYAERKTQLLGLPTHQHRLRHLKSVAVRNLSLPSSVKLCDLTKLQTYFSLHADVQQKAFHESEVIRGSLNPNFKGFDLTLDHAVNTSSSYFVIRLWAGQDDTFALVIEWIVDLSGLSYLGENIHKDDYKYKPNTLLYGMFDGFFGAVDEKEVIAATDNGPVDIFRVSVKVDQSSVKTSYNINSLSRVLTVMRAVKQTENSVRRVRRSIEDRLIKSRARAEKLAEYELLLLRVQQCRDELTTRTQSLQRDGDSQDKLTNTNHQLDIEIKRRSDTLERDKERLHDKRKHFFDCRENYIKTNSQLFIRRKQLISELGVIYPIQETADKFTICGVHLPNSEDFQGVDDTRINVALGSTSHLVLMICHFLDIRPRYQIDHMVSRSKIHDHIIEKVPDNNREFPLFGRRKDRFRFNYAVFLLNKTIAQLRDYCGLGTKDLRLSLPNLKTLLELRLGVKFDMTSSTAAFRRNLLSDRALLQRVGRLNSERKPSPLADTESKHSSDTESRENSTERSLHNMVAVQNSPQRSRESSGDRLELYKAITPDYSPKTTSNGLSESEEERRALSSSLENQVEDKVQSWITAPQSGTLSDFQTWKTDPGTGTLSDLQTDLNNDDENIDARVQALSSRSSSFKMTQATPPEVGETDECDPDPVV